MIDHLSFFTAVLIGLAGAGHCFGMCGGLAASLSIGTKPSSQQSTLYLFLYNLGRISSYCLIAALMAGLLGLFRDQFVTVSQSLRTVAGVLLILMGLYLLGKSSYILQIEHLGKGLWKAMLPIARMFVPIKSPIHALAAGAIWGWLPCGLVYSTLLWVASAETVTQSAWLMLGFGLGTMPAMVMTGYFAQLFRSAWEKWQLHKLSGVFLIIYGLWTIPFFQNMSHSLF